MSQTDLRESAFLKDLYLSELWTSRFADFFDKSLKTDEPPEKIAYLNAGTGTHAFALRDLFGGNSKITAFCEDEETLKIATGKAEVMLSDVIFECGRCEENSFDLVIADASLSTPEDLTSAIGEALSACRPEGTVAVMCVTTGSYGEIFSILWEHYFSKGDAKGGALVERLISGLPTCSSLEEAAKALGLEKVSTKLSNEVFELGAGEEIPSSVLLRKFLFPKWLGPTDENELSDTLESLARMVQEDDTDSSFRFSVKATILTGTRK